jgi:hypothetical protein
VNKREAHQVRRLIVAQDLVEDSLFLEVQLCNDVNKQLEILRAVLQLQRASYNIRVLAQCTALIRMRRAVRVEVKLKTI